MTAPLTQGSLGCGGANGFAQPSYPAARGRWRGTGGHTGRPYNKIAPWYVWRGRSDNAARADVGIGPYTPKKL